MTLSAAEIDTDWVEYESLGATVRAFFAAPSGSGRGPAIVMVHENPGLTPHRQDVARRLAALGYTVLTPNLYSRIGGASPTADSDRERRRRIKAATPNEQVFSDLESGRLFLLAGGRALGDRVGLLGYCMGGSKGLYTACHSDAYRCFVDFYGALSEAADVTPSGEPSSYLPFARNLGCPMQYHVGDQDNVCPLDEVEQLQAELARHGKSADFFVYPGATHAFHDDSGRRYEPEAARLSWERATAFFRTHLCT